MDLWIDFETRSPVDLFKCGAAAYAEPAEVICLAYAFGQSEVRIWVPELPFPEELLVALNDPEMLVNAWNASFEQEIWPRLRELCPQVPEIPMHRWRCSMAHALSCGYPGKLETCAIAVGSVFKKSPDGKKLIDRFCKPRRGKKVAGQFVEPAEFHLSMRLSEFEEVEGAIAASPEMKAPDARLAWETGRFYRYCMADVAAERGVVNKLLPWNRREIKVWHMDRRINARGVKIDDPLVRTLIEVSDARMEELNEQLMITTGGWVEKASKVRDMITWLKTEGVDTDSLSKQNLKALLESIEDTDIPAAKVLGIRQAAAKSSISKLKKMMLWATHDRRLKNNAQYYQSHTGRWGGRGVQLQNLPRGNVSRKMFDMVIEMINANRLHDIRVTFGEPLDVYASLIRGCLIPDDESHKLVAGDFAQIEARVNAWISGENALLDEFEAKGDPYKSLASTIFRKPISSIGKDSFERFVGKCAVLGLGYQMGAQKFIDAVIALGGPRLDLTFTTDVVRIYRNLYTNIVNNWYEVERAAKTAIKVPSTLVKCGVLEFYATPQVLLMRLPSGRSICYPSPRLIDAPSPRGLSEKITYMGMCPFKHQWTRLDTYGGKLVENAVQGISRDILVEAMFRLEDSPFDMLFTVHDEIVTQSKTGTAKELEELLVVRPDWAKRCPIAAEAWSGTRYGK